MVEFVDNDFELDVRTDKVNDTVWLTQDEIAQLFGKARSTITEHINNIFSSNELDSNTSVGISDRSGNHRPAIVKHINNVLKEELDEMVVVAKFANTTKHGAIESKTQTHEVDYYNLNMIISVGYRVKSQRGITFRKWANKVLKEYLIQGYSINNKRLEKLNKVGIFFLYSDIFYIKCYIFVVKRKLNIAFS